MSKQIDFNLETEIQHKDNHIYVSAQYMKIFLQFAKLKRTSFLNTIFQFERRIQVVCGYDNTAVI